MSPSIQTDPLVGDLLMSREFFERSSRVLVEVVAGKDKGKRGKVLQVIREKNRVVVQGVNFLKRHTRPNPQRNIKGGIAEREAPLHVSNVMLVDAQAGKPSRVRMMLEGGTSRRVFAKSGGDVPETSSR